MRRPSGALRFSVTLFLLRLTDMKYVASAPTKGGQLRVSSPFPGSSTLMTSAPMSARFIEQTGPASTRVKSRTRMPSSGREALTFGTGSSFPGAFREASHDRVHPVTRPAGAAPEDPRAIERAQVREIVHVVDRFDGDGRAD